MSVTLKADAATKEWRNVRWRCRTDLEFLCKLLDFPDLTRKHHGPIMDRLQNFPLPPEDVRDKYDNVLPGQKEWTDTNKYRPYHALYKHPHETREVLAGKKRFLLLASRSSMKCVPGNQLVRTWNNGNTPICDIEVGETVVSINDNFTQERGIVLGKQWQGEQECYRITFTSGKTLDVSHNHPLRSILGWVNAEDIKPGERYAVLGKVPEPDNAPYLPYAEILGWYIGDGSFSNNVVTNINPVFHKRIIAATERAGGTAHVTFPKDRAASVRTQGLRPLFKSLGVIDTTSRDKFIPKEIFSADTQTVKELLYGLFMSDGTLGQRGILYTTVSRQLCQDVGQLLLRLGLPSAVYEYENAYGPVFHLTISSKTHVDKFIELVGWDKLNSFRSRFCNPNRDTIPKDWRKLYPKYLFKWGTRPKSLNLPNGKHKGMSTYNLSKSWAKRLGDALDCDRLRGLATNDVCWDVVKTVEPIGKIGTWDLEISTGNFPVNDVVTHNTTLNCVAHTVQWILNYPAMGMAICQANLSKAREILKEIEDKFRYNEKLRYYFPDYCPADKVDDWGKIDSFEIPCRKMALKYERIKTRREPTVKVFSLDAGSAGFHFDVIKFSDIVEENNTGTAEATQKVIQKFQMARYLLVDTAQSRIDVEGTIYSYDDVYSGICERWIENKNNFRNTWGIYVRGVWAKTTENPQFTPDEINDPDVLDEKGKPVSWWPERYPQDEMLQQYAENPFQFATQMCLNPTKTNAEVFSMEIFKANTIKREQLKNIPIAFHWTTVDTADSQGKRADFSVITTCAWSDAGHAYVVDIRRGRFDAATLIKHLFEVHRQYKPISIGIEDTQYVRGLKVSLDAEAHRQNVYPNFMMLQRDSDKSKVVRIMNTLQPNYVSNRLKFLDDLPALEALKSELSRFPHSNRDDILDTLADQFQNRTHFGQLGSRTMPNGIDSQRHADGAYDAEAVMLYRERFLSDADSIAARLLHQWEKREERRLPALDSDVTAGL